MAGIDYGPYRRRDTYGDVLFIGPADNSGIVAALQRVQDGKGHESPLSLSLTQVDIKQGGGFTFSINGTTLGATATQLNRAINAVVNRGVYSGAATYATGDAVSFNGSSFVALVDTAGNAPSAALPPVANAFWSVLASVGATGPAGPVAGPGVSVVGHVATWNSTTGALLADGPAFGTTGPNVLLQLDGGGLVTLSTVPALPASQITSGVFNVARIPSLDAAQTTTGVFVAARLPTASSVAAGIMTAADYQTFQRNTRQARYASAILQV